MKNDLIKRLLNEEQELDPMTENSDAGSGNRYAFAHTLF